MYKVIPLTVEDAFAAIISAVIHDFPQTLASPRNSLLSLLLLVPSFIYPTGSIFCNLKFSVYAEHDFSYV